MMDSTINQQDLGLLARTIIDSSMYMVLGTANESGQPWVSPVYYASAGYKEFYWVSSPEVKYSRNIAMRPQVSIVIFDSQAPIGPGQGVYISGIAEELTARSLTGVLQSSLVLPWHMEGANGNWRMWEFPPFIVYIEQLRQNTGYVTLSAARTIGPRWLCRTSERRNYYDR